MTKQSASKSNRLSHKQRVLKAYPQARECIAWPDDLIYIVVGLNTIIGQGKKGSIAWANAAGKLK